MIKLPLIVIQKKSFFIKLIFLYKYSGRGKMLFINSKFTLKIDLNIKDNRRGGKNVYDR